VRRTIVGFRQDDAEAWVADLDCWHSQHIRHRPPFQLAPWVLDEGGRAGRMGSLLDCPLCDRAEPPEGLHVVRTTEVWDEHTMPIALRKAHRVGRGLWGRLRVVRGHLRFSAQTEPPLDVLVGPEARQSIPPDVEHEVEPQGEVSFFIEFLRPEGRPGGHRS